MVYTLRFFSHQNASLFHNSNVFGSCIIHILYTGCAKNLKKKFWRQKVDRYLTQMTVMIGFMMTAVHFQLHNQDILSAQFLLCGV